MKHTTQNLIALYIFIIGASGIPNGHLYAQTMADGIDIDLHNCLVETLLKNQLVTQSNFYLTLTPKGKELCTKIEALFVKHGVALPV